MKQQWGEESFSLGCAAMRLVLGRRYLPLQLPKGQRNLAIPYEKPWAHAQGRIGHMHAQTRFHQDKVSATGAMPPSSFGMKATLPEVFDNRLVKSLSR